MTDVAGPLMITTLRREDAGSVPLPAPVPIGAPVLIADCVSPLAGETILSLIWRRLDTTHEKRPNQRPGRNSS